MSRGLNGGREPRQGPASRLTDDREPESQLEPRPPTKGARGDKQAEPLRFGPGREPEPSTPKQRRPDWKKASARKVREATAPAEPERREDIPPEQGQPVPEAVPVKPMVQNVPVSAPVEANPSRYSQAVGDNSVGHIKSKW